MKRREQIQPPVTPTVRVVVDRVEIEDPAGEDSLVALLLVMMDRHRHSRAGSKR